MVRPDGGPCCRPLRPRAGSEAELNLVGSRTDNTIQGGYGGP
jgi:hypothetical protein